MDMKTVEMKNIVSSPYNSRKTFDAEKMKELVVSVKEKGILNPILLRPKGSKYEIVCGERRFRAATTAGLTEIPAVVRILTDQQALECMVIENLQREDVHPLEEAEGYEALLKKHGYKTGEDISAKIGKSRAYVYGRLKLCDLIPENRKYFYEGKFSPSVALLVARVPKELQSEAGKTVVQGGNGWSKTGEPMNYKHAKEYIEERLMVQLKEAQFDPKEKGLAGKCSCVECLKRTGSQAELFADVQGKDVCTDPGCFTAKKNAYAQRSVDALKKQGKEVVSPEEAKKLFPYTSENPEHKYVNIDDDDWIGGKRIKYRPLVKACKDTKVTYALHPQSGKVIEMVEKTELPKILKKSGIKLSVGEMPRVKDLAKAKMEGRICRTRRAFWIDKVSTSKDRRCINVVILKILLDDMGWSEAEQIVKGKCESRGYGRPYTIPKLYEIGDTEVQAMITRVVAKKPGVMDDKDLEFLATKLGFSIPKDYVITKEYLEACTKDELVKLIKEFGMSFAQEASAPKKLLVEYVLKMRPKVRCRRSW